MGGERSLDEKLAPQEFITDFVWSTRALLREPRVALVTIALWCLPLIIELSRWRHSNVMVPVVILWPYAFCGWCGAERLFFLRQHEGKAVTLGDLFRATRGFAGRFAKLGCPFMLAIVPLLLLPKLLGHHAAVAGHASSASPLRLPVALGAVVIDLVLTFVPSALVFTTRSVRGALRIGWQMIRQTWPRSGLYVLCPPLALNMLNSIYPTQIHVVKIATTAGLAVLALIAKGATAAFYLRERPVMPEVVEAPSKAPVVPIA